MANDAETSVTFSETEAVLRRLDVDAKQAIVGQLLHDCQSEGLLLLHPANFRWATAGADPVGLHGRDEMPALYLNSQQRWLLCSSVDAQRFFDQELDGLGFQLKEWHWTSNREQMFADLAFGRRIACDQPFRECKYVGTFFATERRRMSAWEIKQLQELGGIVAHAVEATARNVEAGQTEYEVAGQVAHRLLNHGATPIAIQASGDGSNRIHKRRDMTNEIVQRSCLIQATARKYGLHASAARTVWFVDPDANERDEFEAAIRHRAIHLAAAKIGERVNETLEAGKTLLRQTEYEHEWRNASPICLTGRDPSEGIFLPGSQDRWSANWAVVWQEKIGAAQLMDTYLLSNEGWLHLTQSPDWPTRRMLVNNQPFEIPDLLTPEVE